MATRPHLARQDQSHFGNVAGKCRGVAALLATLVELCLQLRARFAPLRDHSGVRLRLRAAERLLHFLERQCGRGAHYGERSGLFDVTARAHRARLLQVETHGATTRNGRSKRRARFRLFLSGALATLRKHRFFSCLLRRSRSFLLCTPQRCVKCLRRGRRIVACCVTVVIAVGPVVSAAVLCGVRAVVMLAVVIAPIPVDPPVTPAAPVVVKPPVFSFVAA